MIGIILGSTGSMESIQGPINREYIIGPKNDDIIKKRRQHKGNEVIMKNDSLKIKTA